MKSATRIPNTSPKRVTHTTMDTIRVTPEIVKGWKSPPFQRELRMSSKVMEVVQQIKSSLGIIPGVITIGVLGGSEYLLDGQHRRECFLLTNLEEGYVDIRKHVFDSMEAMGAEFVHLNSHLVSLRPDDILRGMESSTEGLALLRKECPFVGYDSIRRGGSPSILSMSVVLRSWLGSGPEIPASSSTSAVRLVDRVSVDEAKQCAVFLKLAYQAWERDTAYWPLWNKLNLTLVMWLYRRLVLEQYSGKTPLITGPMFVKCLMSLSAASSYLDWLHTRSLTERDRTPAYNRIKKVFVARLSSEFGKKVMLPHPSWAASPNSTSHKSDA